MKITITHQDFAKEVTHLSEQSKITSEQVKTILSNFFQITDEAALLGKKTQSQRIVDEDCGIQHVPYKLLMKQQNKITSKLCEKVGYSEDDINGTNVLFIESEVQRRKARYWHKYNNIKFSDLLFLLPLLTDGKVGQGCDSSYRPNFENLRLYIESLRERYKDNFAIYGLIMAMDSHSFPIEQESVMFKENCFELYAHYFNHTSVNSGESFVMNCVRDWVMGEYDDESLLTRMLVRLDEECNFMQNYNSTNRIELDEPTFPDEELLFSEPRGLRLRIRDKVRQLKGERNAYTEASYPFALNAKTPYSLGMDEKGKPLFITNGDIREGVHFNCPKNFVATRQIVLAKQIFAGGGLLLIDTGNYGGGEHYAYTYAKIASREKEVICLNERTLRCIRKEHLSTYIRENKIVVVNLPSLEHLHEDDDLSWVTVDEFEATPEKDILPELLSLLKNVEESAKLLPIRERSGTPPFVLITTTVQQYTKTYLEALEASIGALKPFGVGHIVIESGDTDYRYITCGNGAHIEDGKLSPRSLREEFASRTVSRLYKHYFALATNDDAKQPFGCMSERRNLLSDEFFYEYEGVLVSPSTMRLDTKPLREVVSLSKEVLVNMP